MPVGDQSTTGPALGNAGAAWTIEWGAKTVRARKLTQRVKDAFSTGLSQRVIRQFLAAQEGQDGAQQEAVGLLADRIAMGRYDFHSSVAQQALRTEAGVFELALLMLDVDEEDEEGRRKPRRPITRDELFELLAMRGNELNAVMRVVFAASRPPAPPPQPNGQEEDETEGADPNSQGRGPSTPPPQSGG